MSAISAAKSQGYLSYKRLENVSVFPVDHSEFANSSVLSEKRSGVQNSCTGEKTASFAVIRFMTELGMRGRAALPMCINSLGIGASDIGDLIPMPTVQEASFLVDDRKIYGLGFDGDDCVDVSNQILSLPTECVSPGYDLVSVEVLNVSDNNSGSKLEKINPTPGRPNCVDIVLTKNALFHEVMWGAKTCDKHAKFKFDLKVFAVMKQTN